jgi:hypothetical protein
MGAAMIEKIQGSVWARDPHRVASQEPGQGGALRVSLCRARRLPLEPRRRSAIAVLIAAATIAPALFGGATTSFSAQTVSKRQLHYDLVMSADDSVCKPLLGVYNKLLSDAIAAVKKHSTPVSFTSDFEVEQPERFEAIGFRLPPVVMKKGAAGIYQADVFNDGHPRPVLMGVAPRPIMGAYVIILKRDIDPQLLDEVLNKASDGSLTLDWLQQNNAADVDMNFLEWPVPQKYKQYNVPKGYLLTKWPHLRDLLERWVNRAPRTQPFLPVLAFGLTTRVFLHGDRVFFVTNQYVDIRDPKIGDSIVSIYTMSRAGPTDICYFHIDPIG